MNALLDNYVFVLKGLELTITLALTTLFFATIISGTLGVLFTLKNRLIHLCIYLYMEFFRAIPWW